MVQVKFRIESVELVRTEQGVLRGDPFSSGGRFREEEVLASERDAAQRPLGGVAVDLQLAIVNVVGERTPTRARVSDPISVASGFLPLFSALAD